MENLEPVQADLRNSADLRQRVRGPTPVDDGRPAYAGDAYKVEKPVFTMHSPPRDCRIPPREALNWNSRVAWKEAEVFDPRSWETL